MHYLASVARGLSGHAPLLPGSCTLPRPAWDKSLVASQVLWEAFVVAYNLYPCGLLLATSFVLVAATLKSAIWCYHFNGALSRASAVTSFGKWYGEHCHCLLFSLLTPPTIAAIHYCLVGQCTTESTSGSCPWEMPLSQISGSALWELLWDSTL